MNNLSPNQIGKIFTLLTHISTGKLHSNKKDKTKWIMNLKAFRNLSQMVSIALLFP